VARRREVRLTRAEIHQVRTLSAELRGLGGHSHGCGYFNPANSIGKDLRRSGNSHGGSIFTDFVTLTKPSPRQSVTSRKF
jgi:hypothetical protein